LIPTISFCFVLFREQSYSNLGFSYDTGEFTSSVRYAGSYFTGKYNNWGIEDVEVYGQKDYVQQNKVSLLNLLLRLMAVCC
jgi:hypothetical protein